MGLAFIGALILIYMLIVLEFGNFRMPGIIMAPIPLTLIGIIPGHWLLGAEFTATSMIGWIALAGIIVRNSILLVDFSRQAVLSGMSHRESVIQAVRTRTRPILITQLTMIAGSIAIIADPIFQGMAISLLFGAIVATALTLVVIPLACFRAPNAYRMQGEGGPTPLPPQMAASGGAAPATKSKAPSGGRMASIWGGIKMAFYALRALPYFLWLAIKEAFGSLSKVKGYAMMAFYALRALPYFAWLAIKEAFGSIRGRFSRKEVEPVAAKVEQPAKVAAVSNDEAMVEKAVEADKAVEPEKADVKKTAKKGKAQSDKQGSGKKKSKPRKTAKPKTVVDELETGVEAVEKKAEPVVSSVAADAVAVFTGAKKSAKRAVKKTPVVKAKKPVAKKKTIAKAKKSTTKKVKKTDTGNVVSEEKLKPADGPVKSDDLRRIKGVGAALEQELQHAGISTYEKLAHLTLDDLGDARMKLTIMQRAMKDDWMQQASQLAAGEITEFAARVDAGDVPSSGPGAPGNSGKDSEDKK
jgi:predicted flap endonuclease-1-like 5' DNA nuclease